MFRIQVCHGIPPYPSISMAERGAYCSCHYHSLFLHMPPRLRSQLLCRCKGNWKLVLRFLQAQHQASDGASSIFRNDLQMVAGKYHTLLLDRKGNPFVCGFSEFGLLGQGPNILQCQTPTPILFPTSVRITQVSGGHTHAAFLTEAGEVYTCGDNSSCCCGVGDVGTMIFYPTRVDTLKGIPCQQVATGLNYTVVATREGEVYSWGNASHGQLGHGNTQEQFRPRRVDSFGRVGPVAQISAGMSHTLAVTRGGALYSFGYGANYCLGHGDFVSELRPCLVHRLHQQDVFVASVVAGDEHSVAIDSLGQVYTWGKGSCGALGHGDESDKCFPELVNSLKSLRAVQVSARRRKTFVLVDSGTLFAFGGMGIESLGVLDRERSDKVTHPQSLEEALGGQKVVRVSTGLHHTVVLNDKGALLGFGDCCKWQLGLNLLQAIVKPCKIFPEIMCEEN